MKLSYLLKYSATMLGVIFVLFMVLSIYTYFYTSNIVTDYAFKLAAPISIFCMSMVYGKKTRERGILRGLEIWAVYFLIICILKYTFVQPEELNIIKQLIYVPVSILGGIMGVNMKK